MKIRVDTTRRLREISVRGRQGCKKVHQGVPKVYVLLQYLVTIFSNYTFHMCAFMITRSYFYRQKISPKVVAQLCDDVPIIISVSVFLVNRK